MDDDTLDKDKKLFPQKLWDLINDDRYRYCLRWSDDGERVYLNRDEFEEQYLKTSFNQFHTQKAISFVRQMNMYGFRKVDDYYYENENFKRDYQHLLKKMIRRHPIKNSTSPVPPSASLCGGAGVGMPPHHKQNPIVMNAANAASVGAHYPLFNSTTRASSQHMATSAAIAAAAATANNAGNNVLPLTTASSKIKRQYPADRQQEPQDLSSNSSHHHTRKLFKYSKHHSPPLNGHHDSYLANINDPNHDRDAYHDAIQSASSSIFGLTTNNNDHKRNHNQINIDNIFCSNNNINNNNHHHNQPPPSSSQTMPSTSVATQFVRDICDQRHVYLDAQASLEAERLTEKFLSALIDDAKMIVEHNARPNSIDTTRHRPHIDASSLLLALKLMTLRLLGALGD